MVTDVKQNLEDSGMENMRVIPGAYRDPNEKWDNTGIRIIVVEELWRLAEEHGLHKVVLFGSRARGDFRRESDIDLAVSGGNAERFSLDADEMTSTLLKYDVVNLDRPLRPELREAIEREGKVLFEKV